MCIESTGLARGNIGNQMGGLTGSLIPKRSLGEDSTIQPVGQPVMRGGQLPGELTAPQFSDAGGLAGGPMRSNIQPAQPAQLAFELPPELMSAKQGFKGALQGGIKGAPSMLGGLYGAAKR